MAVRLTAPRPLRAAVVAGVLLLAACSTTTAPPSAGGTPAGPATTSGAAPGRPVALGEPVSLGGDGALTLTVREVSVLDSCPGRAVPTQTPELGYFVVLEVTAVAGAHEPVPLPPGAFQLTDAGGTPQQVSTTEASWSCFEDADLVPPFVPPGDPVRGKLVLDSAAPHGLIRHGQGDDVLVWEY
ncbi:hypothetical protein [Georgenia daeguensis]|uniref:DUF4352 domain-containing protein n=1 Tax=Georgenia daeguensis TaxID=908355 RepID=A0ABP6UMD6_9MICO